MSQVTTFSNMSSNPSGSNLLNQKLAQDLLQQKQYQNNNNADLADFGVNDHFTDLNENSSMFQMRCEQDHAQQLEMNDPY